LKLAFPLALALLPVAVLELLLPLALAPLPVAVLELLLPLATALPKAAFALLSPCASAFNPTASLFEKLPGVLLALAPGPQAKLNPFAAVAPPPSAVAGATVAPVAFPTQTNCAAARCGSSEIPAVTVTMAQPANSAERRRFSTIDMMILHVGATDARCVAAAPQPLRRRMIES
jgi:hypothetical protein